ncbi:MAG: transketolase family protein [Pirellulaceae bacterium]
MRDAFVARLTLLAERDPRVMLLTGDLGFGVLTDFARRFPRQYVNVGVAEQNMTGLATGLALEGHIVFTYSIANFVFMRCLEQIRNDAAYHDCNVNVVAVGAGFSYGSLGISHHATEDLAIMRALPSVTVLSPGDDWEAGEATEAAAATRGTCYLRLDRSGTMAATQPAESFQLGKIRQVRDGSDVTLIATGGVLEEALRASQELAVRGLKCRVLSVHTLKPLDTDTLVRAARETGGVITIEEHSILGGLGSAVAETLLEASAAPRFFHRLGLRDQFSSVVGSQAYLRKRYGIDATAILETVERACTRHTAPRPLSRAA